MTYEEKMAAFLAGHWTKDKPTGEGHFPTRDGEEQESGPWHWAYATMHSGYLAINTEPGDIWFWSVPWPGMPKGPIANIRVAASVKTAWEYKSEWIDTGRVDRGEVMVTLDQHGADGWELLTIEAGEGTIRYYYFKRPVPQ